MKRRFRKGISSALTALLLVSVVTPSAIPAIAAEGSPAAFSDLAAGHWASAPLNHWWELGIIQGYDDGTMRPDREITRAEFAAAINRIFGFQAEAKVSPTDVTANAWYQQDIAKAVAAGYFALDSGNNANPNAPLGRADAALGLNAVFGFSGDGTASTVHFSDIGNVGAEKLKAIQALTAKGYIQGFEDSTFRPDKIITRAELFTLVDRIIGLLGKDAGELKGGKVQNSVVINKPEVVLKDTAIEGNLYLTEGIGDGNATLNHVAVKGKTFMNGGGEHSVGIIDSTMSDVEIDKGDNSIRVFASGDSSIDKVTLKSGAKLEETDVKGDGFTDVEVTSDADHADLAGTFDTVNTVGTGTDGGTAPGVPHIIITGTVNELNLNSKVKVTLSNNSVVKKLNAGEKAGSSEIEGKGRIEQTNNQADGLTLNGNPVPKGGSTTSSGGGSGSSPSSPSTPPAEADSNWTLTWQDEFNGSGLDSTKWTAETGRGPDGDGWGNSELEYYKPENATAANGVLTITAKKENVPDNGAGFSSSRLKTMGKFSQKYGKFEFNAKLPVGKGMWPALWMMPEDSEYGTWAASGEIDVMEAIGRVPTEVSSTLHYGQSWPNNTYSGDKFVFPDNGTIDQWHKYAVEWEPGEIRFYVDGALYQTQNNWFSKGTNQADNYAYPAPFDKPFYIIMNLAVGGNFDPQAKTEAQLDLSAFPAQMQVDYVRAYRLKDGIAYRDPVPPVVQKEAIPADARPALQDGNLIYNNNFDQNVPGASESVPGVPDASHWSLLQIPDFGGQATLSIEPVNSRNFARLNITNGGNQNYSVQLIQHFPLVKGHIYKASFDAKAEAARTINMKVTGDTRGFTVYSKNLSYPLGTDAQHYETYFLMAQQTDLQSRIEFNAGLDTNDVWLGNVRLEEVDAIPFDPNGQKSALPDGNLVYNGSFDQGDQTRMTYWNLGNTDTAVATASVSESARELKVAITNGGAGASSVKLNQKGLTIIKNQDYQATFTARADVARDIKVQLASKDGLTVYDEKTVNVGTSNAAATVNLHMPNTSNTDPEAQLVFLLGASTGTVYLDNIRMVMTSFYVDPSVELFPLRNGLFEFGMDPWTSYVHNDGAAAMVGVQNGKAQIDITNNGTQTYSVMLMQTGMKFSKGLTYTLDFDANATEGRDILVTLEDAGFTQYLKQQPTVGTGVAHYHYEFQMTADIAADLKFQLGKVTTQTLGTHSIFIDNVSLDVKGAKHSVSLLTNGTFANGTTGWSSYFNNNGGSMMANMGELTVDLPYEGGQYDSQVMQNNLTLQQNKTYLLTFDARSSVPRTIQVTVEHNGDPYTKYLTPQEVSLGTDKKTYMYVFTMNDPTDSGAHLAFIMGQIGAAVGQAHQLVLSNVSLVETVGPFSVTLGSATVGDTGFTLPVTSAKTGSVYYVVVPAGAAAPDAAQVAAGHNSANAAAVKAGNLAATVGSAVTFNVTGLTQDTDYDVYVAATSGTEKSTVKKLPITTTAASHESVLNGTFDTDTSNWKVYKEANQGLENATVIANNGALKVTFDQYDGYEPWFMQVFQRYIQLVAGNTYTISFQASASQARDIRVSIENAFDYNIVYLPAQTANLTTGMQTFTFTFTPAANESNAKLIFQLGSNHAVAPHFAGQSVFIDDVTLAEQAPVTIPTLTVTAATYTTTGFDLQATSTVTGSVYYVVVPLNAAEPSDVQVVAGQDGAGSPAIAADLHAVTANMSYTFNVTGLASGMSYDVYAVAVNGTTNEKSTVQKITVTTQ